MKPGQDLGSCNLDAYINWQNGSINIEDIASVGIVNQNIAGGPVKKRFALPFVFFEAAPWICEKGFDLFIRGGRGGRKPVLRLSGLLFLPIQEGLQTQPRTCCGSFVLFESRARVLQRNSRLIEANPEHFFRFDLVF